MRRATLDSRGLAVLTTSAGLVTLLVVVTSWITGKDYRVTSTISVVLIGLSGAAFIAAAVLGLLANRLRAYKVTSQESLELLLGEMWGNTETTARSTVAQLQLRSLLSLRAGNNSKVNQLEAALWTQIGGLTLLTSGIAFEYLSRR